MTRMHVLALAAVFGLTAAAADAKPPRPPQAGPKAPTVAASKPATPKVTGPKAPKTTGPKTPRAAAPAAPKQGGPKMAGVPKTTGKPAHAGAGKPAHPAAGKPAHAGAGKATANGSSHVPPGHAKRAGGTTTLAEGTTPPPAMPKNPKLQARLEAMLPPGMTLEQAAEGFRNQGQLIAAIQVSNNLGIPFEDLKTSMVVDGRSLGQSIQQLRPGVDGDAEAARATTWAQQQLDGAEVEPR
ncbi:MAG TPA: hypothetical protein VF198_09465 [Vicinamibacterales bacterium]